jgi:hypothetical protein
VHGDEDMHICGISKFIGNCLSHPFSMSQTQHLHVKGNAYGLMLLILGMPPPQVFSLFTLHNSTLNLTNSQITDEVPNCIIIHILNS